MTRWIFFFLFSGLPGFTGAGQIPPIQLEFFEKRIRPILAQDCYECHRTDGKTKGGLALDHRAAMLEGGGTRDLFDFKNPAQSYLIKVIRHEEEGMEMPKDGVKLNDRVVADFVEWIGMGAPDPRDGPPSDEEVAESRSWDQVMARRKQWWSFQPIHKVDPPEGSGSEIDRFLNRKIEEAGLEKSQKAEDRALVRRLSFALRGLPPSVAEVDRYLADSRPDRWNHLVDEFLASPRFGERWSRHWMDWIRYADSHGSEGDPAIRNAWRYRDYLIRALNNNIPYDTLVMEHLAGDLLQNPRIKDGRNESVLGPAHLRMVYHGFAPTDVLDEKVRFTDDQINVVTKAFQGLTVSCARCHNHKFDAISQEDYYAFFGIFGSTNPGVIRVDAVEEDAIRAEMKQLKISLKQAALQHWVKDQPQWTKRFFESQDQLFDGEQKTNDTLFLRAWAEGREDMSGYLAAGKSPSAAPTESQWQGEGLAAWTTHGEEIEDHPPSTAFSIAREGPSLFSGIYPAGLYSHHLSSKDRGIALSPRIELEGGKELWMRVRGGGNAVVRYAVQNYPRNGTVFPSNTLGKDQWRWIRHDLDYWKGDRIHLELSTNRDQAILAGNEDRSWFGISDALVIQKGSRNPPAETFARMKAYLASRYQPGEALPTFFEALVLGALKAWNDDELNDSQAILLDELLTAGILPNESTIGGDPLTRYRTLEQSLAVPVRAPGVWEADSHDQEFFERGNHKKPAHLVPRRFLEAINDAPYETTGSGRLALARDFVRPDNPFTARIIVNRVWHHLFGSGVVRTTDNFGRLGEQPSHPELLDHLASTFIAQGWDLKELIRHIVLTEAWQRSTVPGSRARERDPDNRLLSYFTLRRLEAEAIRDTLIAISGSLDETPYGNTVDGRSRRRSVYVRTQRNDLDPFLQTFNAPVPLGGKGRRDETNVPAQSLTLLNSPWVMDLARDWAGRLPGDTPADQVKHAYEVAFSRQPIAAELKNALAFIEGMEKERATLMAERAGEERTINELEKEIAGLLENARSALPRQKPLKETGPKPLARWDFEGEARDRAGLLHGTLHGGAEIRNGRLIVGPKQGYFTSEALDRDLGEKTLQVLVQLDSLTQSGGGALGLQTLDGDVFDSIVYAETGPGQWIAGSEFHRRTQATGGPEEKEANQQAVWLSITYAEDGTVQIYRNASPYGRSYQNAGLQKFQKGKAQVIIGNRHGPPSGGRLLFGQIFEARLFDRALTADEISLTIGQELPPSRDELFKMLTTEQQAALTKAESQLAELLKSRRDLPPVSRFSSPLADFTHALFNSKEMIYVR